MYPNIGRVIVTVTYFLFNFTVKIMETRTHNRIKTPLFIVIDIRSFEEEEYNKKVSV